MIKEIKVENRPRERALTLGIEKTSDSELLAILLGTGTKDISAIELGSLVLNKFSIFELSEVSIQELLEISGIGPAKALKIIAAFELFKRINTRRTLVVSNPKTVFGLLRNEMISLTQEHFVVLYLDAQNQLIEQKTIFIGTLNKSIVHPREVFKWAVKLSAAAIILTHNHPSGIVSPSNDDVEITDNFIEIGKLMGITIIDHIVVGKDKYFSMRENGLIKTKSY